MEFFANVKAAWAASAQNNISILAAGVAYYVFLALVPLLAAAVLSYGLIADPEMVARHINGLAERLPAAAAQLIGAQLEAVVATSGGAKGAGLAMALALALFGARNAAGSVIAAIAMAFRDDHQRSIVRANLVALAITLAGLAGAGITVLAISVTATLANALPQMSGFGRILGQVATYAILGGAATFSTALFYRHAPPSKTPRFRRTLPGAAFAGIGLVVLTGLFGFYVANFNSYNATYGSLSAVVVLLTWLYLSAYVIIFGAEIAAARPR